MITAAIAVAYLAAGLALNAALRWCNPTICRRFEPELVFLWPALLLLAMLGG